MAVKANEELHDVLARVTTWPAQDRIVLARKILESVEAAQERPGRGYSAEEVVALLKIPQPVPADAECREILEDELTRKHGG